MSKQEPKFGLSVKRSDHLADVLERLSKVPLNENGKISWDSGKLDKGTFEIIYNLKFKPALEDHIKDGAIWHVLNKCAHAENFSTGYFIKKLRTYIHDLDKRPPQLLFGIGQINCGLNS